MKVHSLDFSHWQGKPIDEGQTPYTEIPIYHVVSICLGIADQVRYLSKDSCGWCTVTKNAPSGEYSVPFQQQLLCMPAAGKFSALTPSLETSAAHVMTGLIKCGHTYDLPFINTTTSLIL